MTNKITIAPCVSKKKFLLCALCLIVFFFAILLMISARWAMTKWGSLNMSELLYHFGTGFEGTSSDLMQDYTLHCLCPAFIFASATGLFFFVIRHKEFLSICLRAVVLGSACMLIYTITFFGKFIGLFDYLRAQSDSYSTLIEDNYVWPDDDLLLFPEKKRNLIYIYLESMELDFTDETAGGSFSQNLIPELTVIANDNENFSGNTHVLNGGYPSYGTGFTMGSMFAQTSGLPLITGIGFNKMETQEEFFPGIITLGDILQQHGYRQVLMIGSDAVFGGRKTYFETHGNYEILDYNYAVSNGWIPADYYVWWGYEDAKLFEFAKQELLSLAKDETPFNFTLLTADTHFPDGYYCELCRNQYDSSEMSNAGYANVISCSSRQISDFLSWIQQQAFFENTTVVIVGDHPTMDAQMISDIHSKSSRRVYTAFINSVQEPLDPSVRRVYSLLDYFPTTLAALGVEIEGNRLALGTNLFSTENTLSERYNDKYIDSEFRKKSAFLSSLETLNEEAQNLIQSFAEGNVICSTTSSSNSICFTADHFDSSNVTSVSVYLWLDGEIEYTRPPYNLEQHDDGTWNTTVDISELKNETIYYEVWATTSTFGDVMIGERGKFHP